MNKKINRTVMVLVVLSLLLSTSGCIDIFFMQSDTKVIADGKGVLAPGFKPGVYESMDEKPERVTIDWDRAAKEYLIQKNGPKRDRFRLLKLRGSYYLMQTRDENEEKYMYLIIQAKDGFIDFVDADKDEKKNCMVTIKGLLVKFGLEMDEERNISGSPKKMVSFCKAVIKKSCLKSGHQLRYIGSE